MRVNKHILFWILAGSMLVLGFGNTYNNYIQSFYFVSLLLPVAMAVSYFFNYYLVPEFLLQKKYLRFTIYSIYAFIASLFLKMLVITIAFIVMANYNYYELNPVMANVFVLAFAVYLVVLLKAFYLLFRRYRNNEFRIRELLKEKEALKMEFITVRADRTLHQIRLDDIFYMESLSDYVKIHFKGDTLITRETISSFEESLPEFFVRIHRSYIINQKYAASFNSTSVVVNEVELPISRTYKKKALKVFSGGNE